MCRRAACQLSGLPQSVPGFAIDRMCAGAMTAVTTTASGIAFGSYDVAIAGGVEHMGRHPMGEGVDPNPRIMSERVVDPQSPNRLRLLPRPLPELPYGQPPRPLCPTPSRLCG